MLKKAQGIRSHSKMKRTKRKRNDSNDANFKTQHTSMAEGIAKEGEHKENQSKAKHNSQSPSS